MSLNHQFIERSDEVIKRYTKSVANGVTGLRLDPDNSTKRLAWFLKTPESSFDFDNKVIIGFDYDEEVIELYSEAEVKIFERLNKKLIEDGILIEYDGERDAINRANVLNDDEVEEIANIKQVPALRKRLEAITAVTTLRRIMSSAVDINRPASVVKVIQERIDELNRGAATS